MTKYDKESRPDWDDYFIFLAFSVALRSDDLYQKIGSIIVEDDSKHIIGTGYNNSIRKFPDELLQPENRDYRRQFMKHAEDNAMRNCTKHPLSLKSNCTLYITAKPCLDCYQDAINFGIKRIRYVDVVGTVTDNHESDRKFIEINRYYMYHNICSILKFDISNEWVQRGMKLLETQEK